MTKSMNEDIVFTKNLYSGKDIIGTVEITIPPESPLYGKYNQMMSSAYNTNPYWLDGTPKDFTTMPYEIIDLIKEYGSN